MFGHSSNQVAIQLPVVSVNKVPIPVAGESQDQPFVGAPLEAEAVIQVSGSILRIVRLLSKQAGTDQRQLSGSSITIVRPSPVPQQHRRSRRQDERASVSQAMRGVLSFLQAK
jgi:hypothetical protein